MQVSSLSRSLSNMETSVRQLQDEKEALVQDLGAVRELCVKLDTTKETLSRQLTSKNIEFEQVWSYNFPVLFAGVWEFNLTSPNLILECFLLFTKPPFQTLSAVYALKSTSFRHFRLFQAFLTDTLTPLYLVPVFSWHLRRLSISCC